MNPFGNPYEKFGGYAGGDPMEEVLSLQTYPAEASFAEATAGCSGTSGCSTSGCDSTAGCSTSGCEMTSSCSTSGCDFTSGCATSGCGDAVSLQ